jgi:hypothetical protein
VTERGRESRSGRGSSLMGSGGEMACVRGLRESHQEIEGRIKVRWKGG